MKYDFFKHVGEKTDSKRLFSRMVEVLTHTGAEVNFHILPKKQRHFLCAIGCISVQDGQLIVEKITVFNREKLDFTFSDRQMIQIIKKAIKNYSRIKAKQVNVKID